MRRLIAIYMLLLPAFFLRGQVFIGTQPTDNPVLLEVQSNNRGVLFPRVSIPNTIHADPVKTPHEGLFVMNTYPGKEGLVFWNGHEWEKLKTVESTMADLEQTGKKSIFIGTWSGGPADSVLARNGYTTVLLKPSMGTLASNNATHVIKEDGIYEVTACFAGVAGKANGFIALNIYHCNRPAKDTTSLAYATASQSFTYKAIATKAVYCGYLNRNDSIGIRIFYGSDKISLNEKLKSAILSIKKISKH